VTLFFRATQCGDAPIAGLAAEPFSVRENGASVSVFESGQTLLSTSLGFERYSLLLLDMSGSTTASFIAGDRIVFNIKGNSYRLIVAVKYAAGIVFIRFVGTHAQYDRINAAEV
jgi:hypothetical protein